ncbi:uncharacterized protein Dana_GF12569 [Drosophila ananassae]|uniref:FCP1 homology domain-containing protein n=1 Tax=Drosophila ananassae TaxID=7217 RepID=B3MFU6_DROAN|nr:CTD nuclear envelope phosphatase 1A [Drosophila ananassae]EDV35628.1 uncharacterized protein Dana_GF12569 [Drosophila ananassae]
MVSQLPAQSAHLVKLAPSSPVAVAVVGNLQRSRSSDNRQPLISILLTSDLGSYVRSFFSLIATKVESYLRPVTEPIYKEVPLSPESQRRLRQVGRKTLVLDLDETLVHSCYSDPETNELVGCSLVPQTAKPDYELSVTLEGLDPIAFQVYKRPHVDVFLKFASKWYDLVIFTASLEVYAAQVVDRLDNGRGMIQKRYYRQHCSSTTSMISKDLTVVNPDMSGTFIIDNSPNAYRDFPDNAIPIKTFIYDPDDTELLNLLPFLDALRFTKDVRSVLSRRVTSR